MFHTHPLRSRPPIHRLGFPPPSETISTNWSLLSSLDRQICLYLREDPGILCWYWRVLPLLTVQPHSLYTRLKVMGVLQPPIFCFPVGTIIALQSDM